MIEHLVDVCDGAQARDDPGVSAVDALAGRMLASAPDAVWAESDADFTAHVAVFVGKYRAQLANAGFDTRPIDRLAPGPMARKLEVTPADIVARVAQDGRKVALNGDASCFLVEFSLKDRDFDPIKDAISAVPGRTFDGASKVWTVPMAQAPAVAEIASRFCFALDHGVADKLARADEIGSEAARAEERKRLREAGYTDLPDNPSWAWRVYLADGGGITLAFPAPFEDERAAEMKDEVKDAGGRFDGENKVWTVSLGVDPAATRDLLSQLVKDYGVSVHPDVWTALARQAEVVRNARDASEATSAEIEIPGLNGTLRSFQRAGVAYVRDCPKTLIADEMGLGKTVQAIAAIHDRSAYPAIVICPSSVVYNWKREVEGWLCEEVSVAVLAGTTEKARRKARDRGDYAANVVISSYDVAKAHEEPLANLGAGAVVLDEAHAIKNHKAQRSISAKRIAQQADVRLLLTGTPILNRPAELIEPLKALDKLEALGGFWAFAERYCNAHWNPHGGWDLSGAANLDELAENLRRIGFVRRRKADVLTELPAKQRTAIDAPIPERSLNEHRQAAKDAAAYADEMAENDDNKRQELIAAGYTGQALRQAMAEYRNSEAAKAQRAEMLVAINKCRRITAHGKVDHAVAFARGVIGNDQPLVLFGEHKEALEAVAGKLYMAGIETALVTGDQTGERRQAAVDAFQNGNAVGAGGPDVLLGTIAAMGEGLTLTRASHVAFFEQAWRPADHDQAEDRLHRIGQQNAVNVYYLLDDRTIDRHMADLIEEKRKKIAQATGDTRAAEGEVSTFDVARRLGAGDARTPA